MHCDHICTIVVILVCILCRLVVINTRDYYHVHAVTTIVIVVN